MPVPRSFRLAAALVPLLASAAVQAQTATKPDGLWRGSGAAAFSLTAGNTSATTMSLQADLARATPQNRWAFVASGNHGRSRVAGVRSTTANKWAGAGQYDHAERPPWYAFVRVAMEGDELIDLGLRSTLALGLGYKLVEGKPLTINVFAGGAHSMDRYSTPQTIDGRSGTRFFRHSVYLGEESVHQLSPTTTLRQRLELTPGISGDRAVLARFNAALAVAITSTLNVQLSVIDSYNGRPPAGNRRNDLGVFFGINVKLGAS